MLARKWTNVLGWKWLMPLSVVILLLLALALRVSLYPFVTNDYKSYIYPWFMFIKIHGGLPALRYNFSNYTILYLSLLSLTSYLPIPAVVAIKTLEILFDGVIAVFLYLLLKMRFQNPWLPLLGAFVIAFTPTVVINGAAWGQIDAMYTSMCLGCLYFILKDRPAWACVFFGLAIAIKLQSIFFLPVLFVLLLRRQLPLKCLILIPVIFFLTFTPALIVGRSPISVLGIYEEQISNPSGSSYGMVIATPNGGISNGSPSNIKNNKRLTFNAPSFYQWLPTQPQPYWKWIGIGLAGLAVALMGFLALISKQKLMPERLIKLALFFALAIPFLLPDMHERYFLLADVLSILYAFYFPRYFFVAILAQLSSLLSYAPYLINTTFVSLKFVALIILFLVLVVGVDLVFDLFPSLGEKLSNKNPLMQDSLQVNPSTALAGEKKQE